MKELLQLLWQNNTASGRTIISLIIFFGIAGCACAIRHYRRYRGMERYWLEAVRDRLHRTHESRNMSAPAAFEEGMADPAPQPAAPLIDAVPIVELRELQESVPPTSLIGDRLSTIARMKQARIKIDVDALQQSSILKESANWSLSLPAYIVSLVMMLGLLGTFIGLSLMVVDIQQALPGAGAHASQWATTVSSLGKILAGKKTAFSATLAGLFFSIVVSLLNFALARAQSELYDRLERFTAEELLPAVAPGVEDQTPWEKLSMQLGDSFEQLKELAVEQSRSAEQLSAVEKTFATIIDNIEAITQRAATAPLQGMAGEMTNVIGQLTVVNSAILGLTEKLPQLVNAFRQTHQTTLAEIHTTMQAQQAGIDRLARTAPAGGSNMFGRLSFVAAGAAAVLVVILILTRVVV
jgi:hypothetical protein